MRPDRARATVASHDARRRHSRWQPTAQAVRFPATTSRISRNHPRLGRPTPTGAYPQPAYGAPPANRRPGAGWWIGAALVAAVLGVGGYLVGHNVGQSNERDNFDAGAPGYNDIYQQGFAAGKGQGTQQGQAQGAAKGEQTGLEQGEQRARAASSRVSRRA